MSHQFWNCHINSEIVTSILKLPHQIWNCHINSKIATSILKLSHQFWNCHINSEIASSIPKLSHQFWSQWVQIFYRDPKHACLAKLSEGWARGARLLKIAQPFLVFDTSGRDKTVCSVSVNIWSSEKRKLNFLNQDHKGYTRLRRYCKLYHLTLSINVLLSACTVCTDITVIFYVPCMCYPCDLVPCTYWSWSCTVEPILVPCTHLVLNLVS